MSRLKAFFSDVDYDSQHIVRIQLAEEEEERTLAEQARQRQVELANFLLQSQRRRFEHLEAAKAKKGKDIDDANGNSHLPPLARSQSKATLTTAARRGSLAEFQMKAMRRNSFADAAGALTVNNPVPTPTFVHHSGSTLRPPSPRNIVPPAVGGSPTTRPAGSASATSPIDVASPPRSRRSGKETSPSLHRSKSKAKKSFHRSAMGAPHANGAAAPSGETVEAWPVAQTSGSIVEWVNGLLDAQAAARAAVDVRYQSMDAWRPAGPDGSPLSAQSAPSPLLRRGGPAGAADTPPAVGAPAWASIYSSISAAGGVDAAPSEGATETRSQAQSPTFGSIASPTRGSIHGKRPAASPPSAPVTGGASRRRRGDRSGGSGGAAGAFSWVTTPPAEGADVSPFRSPQRGGGGGGAVRWGADGAAVSPGTAGSPPPLVGAYLYYGAAGDDGHSSEGTAALARGDADDDSGTAPRAIFGTCPYVGDADESDASTDDHTSTDASANGAARAAAAADDSDVSDDDDDDDEEDDDAHSEGSGSAVSSASSFSTTHHMRKRRRRAKRAAAAAVQATDRRRSRAHALATTPAAQHVAAKWQLAAQELKGLDLERITRALDKSNRVDVLNAVLAKVAASRDGSDLAAAVAARELVAGVGGPDLAASVDILAGVHGPHRQDSRERFAAAAVRTHGDHDDHSSATTTDSDDESDVEMERRAAEQARTAAIMRLRHALDEVGTTVSSSALRLIECLMDDTSNAPSVGRAYAGHMAAKVAAKLHKKLRLEMLAGRATTVRALREWILRRDAANRRGDHAGLEEATKALINLSPELQMIVDTAPKPVDDNGVAYPARVDEFESGMLLKDVHAYSLYCSTNRMSIIVRDIAPGAATAYEGVHRMPADWNDDDGYPLWDRMKNTPTAEGLAATIHTCNFAGKGISIGLKSSPYLAILGYIPLDPLLSKLAIAARTKETDLLNEVRADGDALRAKGGPKGPGDADGMAAVRDGLQRLARIKTDQQALMEKYAHDTVEEFRLSDMRFVALWEDYLEEVVYAKNKRRVSYRFLEQMNDARFLGLTTLRSVGNDAVIQYLVLRKNDAVDDDSPRALVDHDIARDPDGDPYFVITCVRKDPAKRGAAPRESGGWGSRRDSSDARRLSSRRTSQAPGPRSSQQGYHADLADSTSLMALAGETGDWRPRSGSRDSRAWGDDGGNDDLDASAGDADRSDDGRAVDPYNTADMDRTIAKLEIEMARHLRDAETDFYYRVFNSAHRRFERDRGGVVHALLQKGYVLQDVHVATYRRFKVDHVIDRIVEDHDNATVVVPDYDGLAYARDRTPPTWVIKHALSDERNTQLLVQHYEAHDAAMLVMENVPGIGLVQTADIDVVHDCRALTDWKMNHGWEMNNIYKTQELSPGTYVAFWFTGEMELLRNSDDILDFYRRAWMRGVPLPLNPNWPIRIEDGLPYFDKGVPSVDMRADLSKFKERVSSSNDTPWTVPWLRVAYSEIYEADPSTKHLVVETMAVKRQYGLPPPRLILLRELFSAIDSDGSGSIEASEVRIALSGMADADGAFELVMGNADHDASGDITFPEFCHLMANAAPPDDPAFLEPTVAQIIADPLQKLRSPLGEASFDAASPPSGTPRARGAAQSELVRCNDPVFAAYAALADEEKLGEQFLFLRRVEFLPKLVLHREPRDFLQDDSFERRVRLARQMRDDPTAGTGIPMLIGLDKRRNLLDTSSGMVSDGELLQLLRENEHKCLEVVERLFPTVQQRITQRRQRLLREAFYRLNAQCEIFSRKHGRASVLEPALHDFFWRNIAKRDDGGSAVRGAKYTGSLSHLPTPLPTGVSVVPPPGARAVDPVGARPARPMSASHGNHPPNGHIHSHKRRRSSRSGRAAPSSAGGSLVKPQRGLGLMPGAERRGFSELLGGGLNSRKAEGAARSGDAARTGATLPPLVREADKEDTTKRSRVTTTTTDEERQRLEVAPSAMVAVGVKPQEVSKAKHLNGRIQRAMLAIAARRAGERLADPEYRDRRASLLATVFAGESRLIGVLRAVSPLTTPIPDDP